MFELSKGEFLELNIASRAKLLELDGLFLSSHIIDSTMMIELYMIYDFQVECLHSFVSRMIVDIRPIVLDAIQERFMA